MVTEAERLEMNLGLRRELGEDLGDLLMEHLPPTGWGDVARKQDVLVLKEDINSVKEEISSLKSEVASVKQDVSILKSEVASVKQDVRSIKRDINQVRDSIRSTTALLVTVDLALLGLIAGLYLKI